MVHSKAIVQFAWHDRKCGFHYSDCQKSLLNVELFSFSRIFLIFSFLYWNISIWGFRMSPTFHQLAKGGSWIVRGGPSMSSEWSLSFGRFWKFLKFWFPSLAKADPGLARCKNVDCNHWAIFGPGLAKDGMPWISAGGAYVRERKGQKPRVNARIRVRVICTLGFGRRWYAIITKRIREEV